MELRVALGAPGALRARHGSGDQWTGAVVWSLRALLVVPIVLMTPELISLVLRRPDSFANVSESTADVLGTSSLLIFMAMLTVTPINIVTGWRWHLVLRRDFGVAMFFVAALDLILAAITTSSTFHGGFLTRVGGHAVLAAGTVSTLLLVPLVMTANQPAKRWLGRYWKWLHRLTYVVWVGVLLHLVLLFALRGFFLDALAISVPLVFLRLPSIRQRWVRARRAGRQRVTRAVVASVCLAVFAFGYVPFVRELARVGT